MNDLHYLKGEPIFKENFKKLCINDDLTESNAEYLLSCALLILKYYQCDKRYKSYISLSYFIVLKYSTNFLNYKPLYDLSIDLGFYPISRFILSRKLIDGFSLKDIILDETLEFDFKNVREKYIETYDQKRAAESLINSSEQYKGFIAPTSYGKSSIILDFLSKRKSSTIKALIIVPTKSLLIQTYRSVKKAGLGLKLLMHDEMYNLDQSFVAILTQERALRLLIKNTVYFDLVFVDEAHNILKLDSRSIILTRVIKLNELRNPEQEVIYLSPLVEDISNLNSLHHVSNMKEYSISLNIKEPEIFYLSKKGLTSYYDRYLKEFYSLTRDNDYFKYIINESGVKNFIYHNRPIRIEELANELFDNVTDTTNDDELSKLVELLKTEVHEQFYPVKYITKGIIYLHGKMPNQIKEFLEYKFSTIPSLKYVVANSVILEGINLPIDRMFIASIHGLSGKELTNLIGRVNRLNNVFSEKRNDLEGLLPKIHFVENSKFSVGKYENKIKLLSNNSFKDKVSNPTLNNFDFEKLSRSKDENLKTKIKYIVDNEQFVLNEFPEPGLELKKYLIENDFNEVYKNIDNVLERLTQRIVRLQKNLDLKVGNDKWSNLTLIEKVYYFFVSAIENEVKDFEIERLKNELARNFYHYYMTIGLKLPLKDNITSFVNHFELKAKSNDPLMYIGTSYGEVRRNIDPEKYSKNKKVYINLKYKSREFLVNVSIVKIKMEEDFIGFKLNKLLYLLFDYKLISSIEFNNYIYGTNDEKIIELTKYGLSINIINKLIGDKQIENIFFDGTNVLNSNEEFKKYLISQNELFQFEVNKYI